MAAKLRSSAPRSRRPRVNDQPRSGFGSQCLQRSRGRRSDSRQPPDRHRSLASDEALASPAALGWTRLLEFDCRLFGRSRRRSAGASHASSTAAFLVEFPTLTAAAHVNVARRRPHAQVDLVPDAEGPEEALVDRQTSVGANAENVGEP
jgi:hypothetical protein